MEFTAGQALDGGRFATCGSLVTCVVDGTSVYGKVIKFFALNCVHSSDKFAYIEWLNMPEYPMDGTPLVVRVSDNAPACLAPVVVSLFDIDPSRVINERDNGERC